MSEIPVSTIINVDISLQTRGITQAGFGIPMILTDEDTGWGSELARRYSDMDAILEDFASSTDTYAAAAAVFAQSPSPAEVVVGAEGSRVAQVVTVVFSDDLIASNSIACTVDGTALSATAFNTSNSQTLTDLAAKIQATAGVATAVSDGSHTITCTAAKAGVSISISGVTVTGGVSQATATITTTTANVGPAEFIAAIKDEDDDWYGLIWIERDADLVLEMAEYIQTQRKIFGTTTSDVNVLDDTVDTDIASLLNEQGYTRTFVIWNADPTEFIEAAWMGRCFTFNPGEETWKFKTLIGAVADDFTSDEISAAEGKKCNLYVTCKGRDITQQGVAASGEFIDIIRFADWTQARIEERCFAVLADRPKLPLTNSGIAVFETEIRGVLLNGQSVGGISTDPLDENSNNTERATKAFVITMPTSGSLSQNDRANRALTGIRFEARLAGAVHSATINGNLTV